MLASSPKRVPIFYYSWPFWPKFATITKWPLPAYFSRKCHLKNPRKTFSKPRARKGRWRKICQNSQTPSSGGRIKNRKKLWKLWIPAPFVTKGFIWLKDMATKGFGTIGDVSNARNARIRLFPTPQPTQIMTTVKSTVNITISTVRLLKTVKTPPKPSRKWAKRKNRKKLMKSLWIPTCLYRNREPNQERNRLNAPKPLDH